MNAASRVPLRRVLRGIAVLSPVVLCLPAVAQFPFPFDFGARLYPNNLVVSRSVYDNKASNVKVGQMLPPNCNLTTAGCPTPSTAQFDGTYPTVFNNDITDSNFGITSKIYLDRDFAC